MVIGIKMWIGYNIGMTIYAEDIING